MVNEEEKQAFLKRVADLGVKYDHVRQIEVYLPGRAVELVLPNAEGKRNSLQIYLSIRNPAGYIGDSEALRGLEVFGQAYRQEAAEQKGKHPAIDLLENVVSAHQRFILDVHEVSQ